MGQPSQSYRNRLLQLLPRPDLDELNPHLEAVTLAYRQPLYEAGRPLQSVYFPVSGVISMVNTMADGSASEVGTIGNEGIVGLPVILGDELSPMFAYVQVPGTGLCMRAEILRSALQRSRRKPKGLVIVSKRAGKVPDGKLRPSPPGKGRHVVRSQSYGLAEIGNGGLKCSCICTRIATVSIGERPGIHTEPRAFDDFGAGTQLNVRPLVPAALVHQVGGCRS